MTVTELVKRRLSELLDERRLVVWFDGEGAFGEIARAIPACTLVDATASRLRARREADEAVRRLGDASEPLSVRDGRVLVYAPWRRATTEEGLLRDPFEALARIGTPFGDKEGEQLASLARQAMPDRSAEIDRLFAEGRPTVALLEGIGAGARYPLVGEALGTESPVEAAAVLLGKPSAASRVSAVQGAPEELRRLLETEFGFSAGRMRSLSSILAAFGRYTLLSEFMLDLPGGVPESLAEEPHAESTFRDRIFALCDRLRGSDDTREGAIEMARRVEEDLKIPERAKSVVDLGERDTFPFEERTYLARLEALAGSEKLDEARAIIAARQRSIWRHLPERALLWKLAERCLDLLASAAAGKRLLLDAAASPGAWVSAYVARDGLWALDRHQRLVEQGSAECAEDEEVGALVALCRRRYREIAETAQERFLTSVARVGWPPEGMARHTQTFDKHVAPALVERRRVAYFLVDAMRFEMGRDLEAGLDPLGSVSVIPAASILPTTTPCGMAALMPGADGAWALAAVGEELIPVVAGRALPSVEERKALLRERYGDRYRDLTLAQVLTNPKKLAADVGGADLVVVRTQDIDRLGENESLYRARKAMTEVLGELRTATERLSKLGVTTFIFVSDHGHVLLPEIARGDVVSEPAGAWMIAKRRCRVGRAAAPARGVVTIPARLAGIVGSVTDIAVPTGFRVFSDGEAFFHEGISLQECVIPVVVLHARAQVRGGESSGIMVEVRYKRDQFSSRVVGLRVWFNSLLHEHFAIRLEAYDGPSKNAKPVGEAADCDARDPATQLVQLERGQEVQVPLRIDERFTGSSIEVRAIDPATENVLHRLKLKNGALE